jgi:ADP-ribose pyrophosphatase YjhB (NUDIX family)
MVRKVAAYIHRPGARGMGRLLVFMHRDYPEAGVQVPAGTVEPQEELAEAILREVAEESGLTTCRLVRRLGFHQFTRSHDGAFVEREFFLLTASAETPETWEHTVLAAGQDEGMVFLYSWASADEHLHLAGDLGQYLTPKHVPEFYRTGA